MIKKINLLTVIFLTIFLYSCQSAKEAFQSNKRSDQSDEFLVQKKNPLTMPPDFEKLPTPGNQEVLQKNTGNSSEIKELLIGSGDAQTENVNEDEICNPKVTVCKNSGIENSILKKIQ